MPFNITDDISRMLVAGQKEIFTKNLEAYPREWKQYCTIKNSNKRKETYDSIGNLKAAELKPEGAPIQYGKVTQAYQTTIQNQTIANGYAHSIEAIKYDLYGVINSVKASELSRTMGDYEENTAIYWVNNITTVNLADGVPMASASHPLVNSALLNDNYPTAASIADPDSHYTALNVFNNFKNHAGTPMKTRATDAMTYIGNQFTIEELWRSGNKAYEMSNTKNVLPPITWHYSTYMTDTNGWMYWDSRFEHFIFQWFAQTEFEQDKDKVWTKNMYFNAMAIYNTGAIPNVGLVWNDGV